MSSKNDKQPNISIVIPCYKAEKYVARSINSVVKQDKVITQVIVVEDGFYDKTGSIVIEYGDQIRYIALKNNQGAPYARNIGLAYVENDYVLFLDSDDYMEGDLLIGLYESIEANNASLAFGPRIKRWETGKKEVIFYPPLNESPLEVVERWLKGNSGPNPASVLWRTSEIRRIGGWNTNFVRNQDGELIIRAMLNGCTVSSSQIGAGIYVQHQLESVSKRLDPSSFESQELLESYIKDYAANNTSIYTALNAFRFNNAYYAFSNDLIEIGNKWEEKWRDNFHLLNELRGCRLQIVIKTIICIILGIRAFIHLYNCWAKVKNKLAKII